MKQKKEEGEQKEETAKTVGIRHVHFMHANEPTLSMGIYKISFCQERDNFQKEKNYVRRAWLDCGVVFPSS